MAPWRHSAEYTVWALLFLALAGAADHEALQIYASKGSTVLIPGVEIELKGNGALQWTVEKTGGARPVPILSYHYGSPEVEVQQDYEHRVNLSFTNGSLQLFNVSIQDNGRYTLNLIFEKKTFVFDLSGLEPVSEIEVAMVSSTRECSVLLRCEALGDVMNMTWKTNGGELNHNVTRLGNISQLTVKVDSSGNYTCVAWNPVSELKKTYKLVLDSTGWAYNLAGTQDGSASFPGKEFLGHCEWIFYGKENSSLLGKHVLTTDQKNCPDHVYELYKGRIELSCNGSFILQKLSLEDKGLYQLTCDLTRIYNYCLSVKELI